MRDRKAARYLGLMASLLVLVALAACGTSSNNSNNSNNFNNSSNPTIPSDPSTGSSVTGTVTWPDGQPVTNAHVYFENHDLAVCVNNPQGFTGVGWTEGENCNYFFQYVQLGSDGSYSLPGCPCADLTAYVDVSAAVMTQANGGSECWIIAQDNDQSDQNYQNYSGFQANPGDVIDWQARDMPCSGSLYSSDSAAVQSEASDVLPTLNTGSWQDAEQATNGG